MRLGPPTNGSARCPLEPWPCDGQEHKRATPTSVTSRTLLAGAVAAALAVLVTVLATTVGNAGAFEGAATDRATGPERTVRVISG